MTTRWRNLNDAQADGLACVECARDYLRAPAGTSSVPVGRSHTGSQVFACVDCAGPDAVNRAGGRLTRGDR